MNEPSERARAVALDERRMRQIANQWAIINRLLDGAVDSDKIVATIADAAERAAVWQARYDMARKYLPSDEVRHIEDTHPLPADG